MWYPLTLWEFCSITNRLAFLQFDPWLQVKYYSVSSLIVSFKLFVSQNIAKDLDAKAELQGVKRVTLGAPVQLGYTVGDQDSSFFTHCFIPLLPVVTGNRLTLFKNHPDF